MGEAVGVLGAKRGQRVRAVLVAGLKGVGRVRFALAVANDDEVLVLGHAASRCTVAQQLLRWGTPAARAKLAVGDVVRHRRKVP